MNRIISHVVQADIDRAIIEDDYTPTTPSAIRLTNLLFTISRFYPSSEAYTKSSTLWHSRERGGDHLLLVLLKGYIKKFFPSMVSKDASILARILTTNHVFASIFQRMSETVPLNYMIPPAFRNSEHKSSTKLLGDCFETLIYVYYCQLDKNQELISVYTKPIFEPLIFAAAKSLERCKGLCSQLGNIKYNAENNGDTNDGWSVPQV